MTGHSASRWAAPSTAPVTGMPAAARAWVSRRSRAGSTVRSQTLPVLLVSTGLAGGDRQVQVEQQRTGTEPGQEGQRPDRLAAGRLPVDAVRGDAWPRRRLRSARAPVPEPASRHGRFTGTSRCCSCASDPWLTACSTRPPAGAGGERDGGRGAGRGRLRLGIAPVLRADPAAPAASRRPAVVEPALRRPGRSSWIDTFTARKSADRPHQLDPAQRAPCSQPPSRRWGCWRRCRSGPAAARRSANRPAAAAAAAARPAGAARVRSGRR